MSPLPYLSSALTIIFNSFNIIVLGKDNMIKSLFFSISLLLLLMFVLPGCATLSPGGKGEAEKFDIRGTWEFTMVQGTYQKMGLMTFSGRSETSGTVLMSHMAMDGTWTVKGKRIKFLLTGLTGAGNIRERFNGTIDSKSNMGGTVSYVLENRRDMPVNGTWETTRKVKIK